MPVKITNNTSKVFRNIANDIDKFIYGVTSIGATLSMEYAPLEYGNLRASQRFDTGQTGNVIWGKVSFGTGISEPYPHILENSENWKPRPPDQKAGPAWNPNARPHYLRMGFESAEAEAQIAQLRKRLAK